MIRIVIIITAGLLLAGCPSDCSVGFKGPFYFHTHDGDMACQMMRNSHGKVATQ